ncbi:conserved membrane hypothetical protein [Burkholderiales bacterium 8X]|nr:conserved membrane hypothetical protein [Burkholderiales bacterium 8X]
MAFFIAFVTFLTVHQHYAITQFYWDSEQYWRLASIESLLNFPKSIRGYFYPLMLAPVKLASELLGDRWYWGFRFASSLIYAFFLAVIVPDAFVRFYGGRLTLIRRLVIPLLVACIFPGLMLYPLSDLPACLLMVMGVWLAFRSADERKLRLMFYAGLLLSAAYNVRTIYLGVIVVVLFTLPMVLLQGQRWRSRGLSVGVFALGLVAISIPQMVINARTHGVASPLVIATVTGRSLAAAQLQWGLTMQRYESSIDKRMAAPQVVYLDRAGEQLFAEENIQSPMTVRGYIRLVMKRPLDFLGVYGRHLVNGLDVRDGKVYITSLSAKKNWLSVVNFVIILLGLVALAAVKTTKRSALATMILILPVVAILPGAIETRFFFPVHLLLYGLLACHFRWQILRDYLVRRPVLAPLVAFALLACFLGISTSTMSGLTHFYPSKYL